MDIDYTTIARLLRDVGIPGDRVGFFIRLLTTPNQSLLRSVKVWAMEGAILSDRFSQSHLKLMMWQSLHKVESPSNFAHTLNGPAPRSKNYRSSVWCRLLWLSPLLVRSLLSWLGWVVDPLF